LLYKLRFIVQLSWYAEDTKKGSAVMEYQIRYVYGHYQVYSSSGLFLFSADTEAEALEDLKDLA
jgi:hypothetical protein